MTSIILGSASPRRKEILSYFTLPFRQVSSDFDEESVSFQGKPAEHAVLLSQKKAEALSHRFPTEVILTADSVVYCQGKLYNKPANEEEAISFLKEFGGHWQHVFTAVTVRKGEKVYSGYEETKLLFHSLTEDQIQKFHQHCYFLDKAGGYAIEKGGNLIVSRMEGCYYNVLGLPITLTRNLLLHMGIDLCDFLKSF